MRLALILLAGALPSLAQISHPVFNSHTAIVSAPKQTVQTTHMAGTLCNGTFYTFSGQTGSGVGTLTAKTQTWDGSMLSAWATETDIPTNGWGGLALCFSNTKIVIWLGSLVGSGTDSALVYSYDLAGKTFTALNNSPAALAHPGLRGVAIGQYGYILYNATLQKYDSSGDTYSALTGPSGNPGTYATCVTDGLVVYALDGFQNLQKIKAYTIASDTWNDTFAAMPYTAWSIAADYDGAGKIYIAFGRPDFTGIRLQLYSFNTSSKVFTQLSTEVTAGCDTCLGWLHGDYFDVIGIRIVGNSQVQTLGYNGRYSISGKSWLTRAGGTGF